jgi:hypothetical protein
MNFLSGAFSFVANLVGLAGQILGLKNAPEMKKAKTENQIERVDVENTKSVQDAIQSGDLSKLERE